MDITYEVYNDEQQIIDKINSLEPMFQRLSSENNIEVLCYEDLYFLSAIDKSILSRTSSSSNATEMFLSSIILLFFFILASPFADTKCRHKYKNFPARYPQHRFI